jgi:hypothetical protein
MSSVIHFDPTALGHPLTLTELEAIARGEARVVSRSHRGVPQSYRLNGDQRRLYEQVKMQGFFFDKPKNVAWLSQWWLETTGQPCLRIRTRGKFATVSMDLISIDRDDGNTWTGTSDHRDASSAVRAKYSAQCRDRIEALKVQPIFLPEGAKSIDQTMLRRLAEICVHDYFGSVVRWRGSLWEFDGVCHRPISHRWESLTYQAWLVLERVVHADGSYFLHKSSDMKRITQEVRKTASVPETTGEPPLWTEQYDGDPDAKHCIVGSGRIVDFHSRETHPLSPRFFVTAVGAGDLVKDLALAAGAHPQGHFYFGTYTAVEKIPVENAASFACQLRELYWRVIGKNPPGEEAS